MKTNKLILAFLFVGTLLATMSCDKEEEAFVYNGDQFVTVDKPVSILEIGEEVTVTPSFGENTAPKSNYTWSVDNEGVVEMVINNDNTIKLTALSEGEATAKFASEDGRIYATTKIVVKGEEEQIGELLAPLYVSFGMDGPIDGWNGFIGEANSAQGSTILDLKDENGAVTDLVITITKEFNGRNTAGESGTNTDFNMPNGVSTFSFYGNAGAAWLGKEIKESEFRISGLDKDKTYNFCFFGSRAGVGDNRETAYIVKGDTEQSVTLNTSSNNAKTVCVEGLKPNAAGEVTVLVTAGENNNNGNKFFYINAMRISPSSTEAE